MPRILGEEIAYSLPFTTAQDIFPLFNSRPTAFTSRQVSQMNMFQKLHQLFIRPSCRLELGVRVRIDDPIMEVEW